MSFLTDNDEVGMTYGSLAPGAAQAPQPIPLDPAILARMQRPPIMNGEPPHPIEHVGRMISDHANLLRQRLYAAHLQNGLAPVDDERVADPLSLITENTKSTGYSNLATLLAKFQGRQPNSHRVGFPGHAPRGSGQF